MIRRQKEKYGWEFIFLGANIDAAKEAARFGINADRAANYHADHQGTAVIYEAVSEAVCNVRACKPMSADWKRNVDKDYESRKNNIEKDEMSEDCETSCGGIQPIIIT
jgi:hypothetical protein